MEQGFVDILKKLITEQGKEAILNPAKCKSFLADYTRGEYKRESRLLLQAVKAEVAREIDTTDELAICKEQQASKLQEEYFMATEIAVDVVDTLALILRRDTSWTEIPNKKNASRSDKQSGKHRNLNQTQKSKQNSSERNDDYKNIESRDITIINIEKFEPYNSIINLGGHINRQNENIFEKIKNEIEKNIENKDDKDELLSYVIEMERNKNIKEVFRSYYDKFINRLGTYMSIFGPFLPYLVAYLK